MPKGSKAPGRLKAGKAAHRAPVARETPPPAPFLRFHHSVPLRGRTLAVLDALERSADPTKHRESLAGVVVELTRAGLDAYFMKPLKDAKAGFVLEQSAAMGMSGAVQVMSSIVRSVLGRMGPEQLLSISSSIRRFMR